MLYDAINPILYIVGVEHLRCDAGDFEVKPRSFSSLAFRMSGNVSIFSEDKQYFVNTNDILYMPQNMGYTAQYTDTEMIVVHFVTARNDSEIEIYPFESGEQIYKMFLQLNSLWKNKGTGYTTYSMALLYAILGTILEKVTHANLPEHFLSAISFINSNFKDSALSINTICKNVGISETTFRQLFKKHYQKTPIKYITELRLECARNLISSGTTIESATFESGFNDSKYFSRVVRKHLNCTPRDLKNYGR